MKEKKISTEDPNLDEVLDKKESNDNFLTLFNDEVHTFDFVIETLMDVCCHDIVQAEQCTFIVHFKGKCEVKKGSLDLLKPMKKELANRGLMATIE